MSRLEGEKKALLVRDGSTEGTDDYEIKTYSDNIVLTSTTQKETGESGKSKPNSELTKNEKYTSLNDFLAKAEAVYDLGTDSNGNNGNDLPKAIRLNGENASSAPNYSVAIGEGSKATKNNSFAIGSNASARAPQAVAFGEGTAASGNNSFAIGYGTVASSKNSVAIGEGTTAKDRNNAFAAGYQTTANGKNSVAFGNNTIVSGENSFSSGLNNSVSGSQVVVFGKNNSVFGKNGIVCGENNNSGSGNSNIIFGKNNKIADYGIDFRTFKDEKTFTTPYDDIIVDADNGELSFKLNVSGPGWYVKSWNIVYSPIIGPSEISTNSENYSLLDIEEYPKMLDNILTIKVQTSPGYSFSSLKSFSVTVGRMDGHYNYTPENNIVLGQNNKIGITQYEFELSLNDGPYSCTLGLNPNGERNVLSALTDLQRKHLLTYVSSSNQIWIAKCTFGSTIFYLPLVFGSVFIENKKYVTINNIESIKEHFVESATMETLHRTYLNDSIVTPDMSFITPPSKTILGQYNDLDSDDIFQIGCGTSDSNRKNALSIDKDGFVKIGEENYLTSSGRTTNLSTNVDQLSEITSLKLTKGMWIISANVTFNSGETSEDRNLAIAITTDSEYWGIRQTNKHFYSLLSTTTIKCFNKDTTVYLKGASTITPITGEQGWQARGTIIAARIG